MGIAQIVHDPSDIKEEKLVESGRVAHPPLTFEVQGQALAFHKTFSSKVPSISIITSTTVKTLLNGGAAVAVAVLLVGPPERFRTVKGAVVVVSVVENSMFVQTKGRNSFSPWLSSTGVAVSLSGDCGKVLGTNGFQGS